MIEQEQISAVDSELESKVLAGQVVSSCWRFLSETEKARIVADCPVIEFGPEDAIILQGEHGQTMYFLLAGEVEIFRTDQGERRSIAVLTPESKPPYFGEIALITDDVRTADVVALTPVKLLQLDRRQYEDLPDQAKADIRQIALARAKGFADVGLTLEDVIAIDDLEFQPAFARWQSELFIEGEEELNPRKLALEVQSYVYIARRAKTAYVDAVRFQVREIAHRIKQGFISGEPLEFTTQVITPLLRKAAEYSRSSPSVNALSDANKLERLAAHALHVVRILGTKYAASELVG